MSRGTGIALGATLLNGSPSALEPSLRAIMEYNPSAYIVKGNAVELNKSIFVPHVVLGVPPIARLSSWCENRRRAACENDHSHPFIGLMDQYLASTLDADVTHRMMMACCVGDDGAPMTSMAATGVLITSADCGERKAGQALARMLRQEVTASPILREHGVFVSVSRWYGGVHLGSARFNIITKTARACIHAALSIYDAKRQ